MGFARRTRLRIVREGGKAEHERQPRTLVSLRSGFHAFSVSGLAV